MRKIPFIVVLLLISSICSATPEPYDYPIDNRYAATVIGTPREFRAPLPQKIPEKILGIDVSDDREIPDVLWYHEKLWYSLVYQDHKAPLIFVIAGTGASYHSPKMQSLQRVFFKAGFHVISLSSPTHPNFIVTASSTRIPGHIKYDSQDLYHLMQVVWMQVRDRVEVSKFFLTGYSLGGAQAAFVSKLDEEKKIFNFDKVLMINPPVSLFSSVNILDDMLANNIPGGPDNFDAFFNQVMEKFSEVYQTTDDVEFNDRFLYKIYQNNHHKDEHENENIEALIGTAFRQSSANMVFVSDLMTNTGFVIPKNHVFSRYESLTDYFIVTVRVSFMDYFHEMFYPYFQSKFPGLTEQELIDSLSLKTIEPYLANTRKVAMVTNADEIILAPGELDYLRRIFQSRAKIYPAGGHCGNMDHKDNVAFMIDYFTR